MSSRQQARLYRRWVFGLGMALGLAAGVAAQTGGTAAPAAPVMPPGVERVVSVEGITEYRLMNGLKVLLFPDPSKETITVNVTYLVGSRHEGYGETGMAHLLEHMVFKGSTKHPNIPQELTEHGARPNGTTWFDRTNYFETFQASDANLDWALDLEADRMVNSFIARKDLDSEMTVVRNEFEAGENEPVWVLVDRTHSAAFLWHNYGKSTIGARSDIENVPIERLQAFYRTYYQPDNAILLVAGKFDEPKTLGLIQAKFGSIPRPGRGLPATYTAEPTQDGERTVTLRRVGEVQAVCAAYHIPAGSHSDYTAVEVLASILGDTPSGRLYKALVVSKKASSVEGYGFQLREPGLLTFQAEVRKEKPLDAARDTLLQTVEGIASSPPSPEEVERARAKLLKEIALNLRSSEQIGLELSEWAAMGDWRLLFLHRDRIAKVTPADVQRVATAYLKPSNRTVGLFIPTEKPDRAPIPPAPSIAEMLKDYKGGEAISAGEAFDPSPANIDAHTTRPTSGGLKLALLPKRTRGATVNASLVLRYGDRKSLANRTTTGRLTADMLMRGTTRRTRQQIEDELDRLQARVFVTGGVGNTSVSIETTRENLPAVIKLVAEILRQPSFPAAELAQLKQERLAVIEQQKSDPSAIVFNAYRRHVEPYPKDDARYTPTPDEEAAQVNAVTLNDIRKFHADFYGASDSELAVVGDFDDSAIAQLAGDLFGSWKSPRPYTRIANVYQEVAPVNQTVETPDKANADFMAGMLLKVRDDDPDYPALVLGNYMLGGGFLNSRLATRLRQKDGLSYGVGSNLTADAIEQRTSFTASAIYAPENAARLEAAFKEELARALKDGFTADEVTKAKTGYLQSQQVSRAQDRGLARKLATYRFLNRTLAWDADFEKRLQALTPEVIVTAMRKHIDPAKITIVKAGDFGKSAGR